MGVIEENIANICKAQIFVWLRQILQMFVGLKYLCGRG